jgi:hypothetical protein
MMSHRGRRLGLIATTTALIVTPALVAADEYWLDFGAWLSGLPPTVSNGLVPAAMLIASLIGFYQLLRRRSSASNNEAIQTVFVLLLVAFAILTITGVWFRGSGMALTWPWNV